MKQEVEIEFKNLLTKEEFDRLKHIFHIEEHQFMYQENHYFDTPQFSLKQKGAALRIRVKDDSYTLTLKQAMKEGMLETHEPLTKEEAQSLLNNFRTVRGDIQNILQAIGVAPETLQYFGTLATYRTQIPYEDGILVFDHSHYLQTDDYEIEYETDDFTCGKETFERLLASLNIPVRPTANKIKRFYAKKYETEDHQ
ncbi:uncharacterized protein YjbK [Anoxybacillus tepidamans]|uniref:Uncharacterized protein YjbK n=1 Tax=Anoxybacteroides tepidamans TaxID=265948 RepID=A0A7W8MVP6_9BACL|nr:CYTH domain-containing protein [Anoxybacillus tepidamans]MBB5325544.1 uncharacterized protein YjbK [Anoxybacillus tepidamans]